MYVKLVLSLSFCLASSSSNQLPEQCMDTFFFTSVDFYYENLQDYQNRNVTGCLQDDKAYRLNVRTRTGILRKGSFKNVPNVKILTMAMTEPPDIDPGAFDNIPQLEHIGMPYNSITVIKRNVFTGLPNIKTIYLNSNRITTIEEQAFAEIRGPLELNLADNDLSAINEHWFTNSVIVKLYLNNNNIASITTQTFSRMSGLKYLDLSHNHFYTIPEASFAKHRNLEVLNLASNNLDNLDFLKGVMVTNLSIAFNRFNFIDPKFSSAKRIAIYPNPWKCSCLRKFWSEAEKKNIKYIYPDEDNNVIWNYSLPVCRVVKPEKFCNYVKDDALFEQYKQQVDYTWKARSNYPEFKWLF